MPFIQEWELAYKKAMALQPYILFALVILLSQSFSQGRTSLAAIAMQIAYSLADNFLSDPLPDNFMTLGYWLLAALLPLNLLQIQLQPDRRLLSRHGSGFIAFLLLQLSWSCLVVYHFQSSDFKWLTHSLLFNLQAWSPLPIILIVLSVMTIAYQARLVLKRNHSHDQALFVCSLFAFISFILIDIPYVTSSAFSLAGLLILLNLISNSHEQAYIDQLTGISGRRALETELKHLGRTYTIAMLDIDHFKQFNDKYGHDTGDDVLRLVASLMSEVDGGAEVFRYGGEEFTILFKGREQRECMASLESLRRRVETYPLVLRHYSDRPRSDTEGKNSRNQPSHHERQQVQVTISIGVADSYLEPKPERVMKTADKALYHAKATGRNRISNKTS
ncbi:GGDEF domain-containing protein [Photobacterium sanctipauli]|uniref:GGDEF domain-containing protein n=1 Tax=Photobacterium sanctipauli TaxID=1342794 RepID=UPI0020A6AB70|nr:GGDEF domain-containing protein [Photobacterium sanctipauli]